MKKTELFPAFIWTCDDCGRDNFVRGITPEMDIEEHESHFRHYYQLQDHEELPEDWESFEVMLAPTEVTCQHCGETYESHCAGDISGED